MATVKLSALPALPKMSRAGKPKTNECACGCGMLTASTFVPGHDSRLRGWALRLERGIVTPKEFPGTPGELKAAQAFLNANGGAVPTHGKIVPAAVAATTDKKLAKRQAREAKRAAQVKVELAGEPDAATV